MNVRNNSSIIIVFLSIASSIKSKGSKGSKSKDMKMAGTTHYSGDGEEDQTDTDLTDTLRDSNSHT